MRANSVFDPVILQRAANRSEREQVVSILDAALAAADPVAAVKRAVRCEGQLLWVDGQRYDLANYDRLYVVGGGKASGAMAAALEDILGSWLSAGWVNVKDGYTAPTRIVHLAEASHPLPDERGLAGARRMVDLLQGTMPRDLVFCVISGGGSALMTLPVDGVSLADMQALTAELLCCGATINEINTIRKHLSQLKGGNLARHAAPATVIAIIVSDVIGSPLDIIASGPTVPDTGTYGQALAVLRKYDLLDAVPASILQYLRAGVKGEVAETPKVGDPIFGRVQNVVVADNRLAAEALQQKAEALGFNTLLLTTFAEGEAREVAKLLVAIAKEIAATGQPVAAPACVIIGGETTVTVTGQGRGGRNQELALAAAIGMRGLERTMIVSLATDGTDGPTDAAGAIVEGATLDWAQALGLDAQQYLRNNDAYHFFQPLGDLLLTGPTNTNVNDLSLVLVW